MTISITVIAFQSVTPAKVTPPKISRRISVCKNLPQETLGAHFRLILYYRSAPGKVGSALTTSAYIKETLGVALAEEPMLAGRLRRSGAAGCEWELRFNDAGVRLVQATAEAEMAEVLDAGDREEMEWGLVYWRDVERENTDQSALFYVQVTEFQCSGYSIGVSCSLLLADPLFLMNFLLKWANVHRRMITASSLADDSLFHLKHFRLSPLPLHLAAMPAAASTNSTLLFRIPLAGYPFFSVTETSPSAVGNLILHSDHAGNLKVELGDGRNAGAEGHHDMVSVMEWEELGAGELMLGEGNMPVAVSYRIVPGGIRGLVVAMDPGGGSDILVSITVPVSAKS